MMDVLLNGFDTILDTRGGVDAARREKRMNEARGGNSGHEFDEPWTKDMRKYRDTIFEAAANAKLPPLRTSNEQASIEQSIHQGQ